MNLATVEMGSCPDNSKTDTETLFNQHAQIRYCILLAAAAGAAAMSGGGGGRWRLPISSDHGITPCQVLPSNG
jgi:hypothetical protein